MNTNNYSVKNNGEEIVFTSISQFVNYCLKNNEKLDISDEKLLNLYNFLNYYKNIKYTCETEMKDFNTNLVDSENNDIVKDILNKFVYLNNDGKYLRATLAALGYQSVKQDNDYLPLALALEVFQTSILIHDDIIDKAEKRRGKDTIPVMYKNEMTKDVLDNDFWEKRDNFANSMALCMGDLGFYLTSGILLDSYKNNPNLGSILTYYNNVAIKTNKGEMLDVYLPFVEEYYNHSLDLEDKIFEIYTLKTAWYSVIGPFCLGLVLAGANENTIKSMEKILLDVGIAYQIKDDLLGIYGDETKTGKTASDVMEYKQTILYSYTLNTDYKEELLKYYGTSNSLKVAEIFEMSGAKNYAVDKMNELFDKSILNIKNTDLPEKSKSILLGFVCFLKERDK